MEPLEAMMFALVKQFAQEFVPAPMQEKFEAAVVEAQQTLGRDPKLASWVKSKIACIDTWQGVLQAPQQLSDVLATVSTALLNNQYLEILYLSEKGELRKEVCPLALLERDQVLYVVLHFSGYADARLLALHRIVSATGIPASVTHVGQPFVLDAFLRDGLPFSLPGEQTLNLHLRLDETTYRTFQGRPLLGTSLISPPIDGWFEVKAQEVPNTMELRWWLLGFGDKVRILDPEPLARELQYLLYDSLTGLLSRRACQEHLERMVSTVQRTGQASAVALIDIDHFKWINDDLGHSAGDLALKEISRRLKSACRSMDVVGRWGGEEFLILLPETSLQEAALLAERLREQIAATPCLLDSYEITRDVTISIGISAVSPLPQQIKHENVTEQVDNVLKKADRALYKAKVSRNCVEIFEAP